MMKFSLAHFPKAKQKAIGLSFAFTFLFSCLLLSSVVVYAEEVALVNPNFHSVATGGYWNSYSTWEENRGKNCAVDDCVLPNAGDEVEINGVVLINGSETIAGLLVDETGLLQNRNGYPYTLAINGDVINNGTIQNNTSSVLSLEVSGNIQNNGTWNPYKTTLFDNVEILNTTTIEGYLVCDGHALIVNLPNTVTFASGLGDASIFNGTGVIKLIGDIGAPISGTISKLYISGNNKNIGTDITISKIIFERNTFISGTTIINGDVEIDGGVTIQNRNGYPHTLTINGDIINNGTIRNNTSGSLSLEVSGDIQNNGTWNPRKTTLLDDVEILNTTTIGGYLVCDRHALVVNSPNAVTLSSNTSGIDIFNGTGIIDLTGSVLGTILGAIPELYISGGNYKYVGADITIDKVIFEGNVLISDTTVINGDVEINSGVFLQNHSGYPHTLTINGDTINNGTIRNNTSGSLSLEVSGDIQNNGTWDPYRMTLLNDVEVVNTTTISGILICNDHALIVNAPNTVTLASNTSGADIFNGTGIINMTGSVFGTISGTIPELYISGGNHKYVGADITIDKVIFVGSVLISNTATINGDVEINSDIVIQNHSGYPGTFVIDGNIFNNGTIRNNTSGSLSLEVSGDIQNNGVWNNYRTSLFWDPIVHQCEFNISDDKDIWPDPITLAINTYNITGLLDDVKYWCVRQDLAPFVAPWSEVRTINGDLGINQSPTLSSLNQYKSDRETVLEESETTVNDTVIFSAQIDDLDGDQVELQVKLRFKDDAFTGPDDEGILKSGFVSAGSEVTLVARNLANGEYHWQARVVDERGKASTWQEFGEAGNVDFEVDLKVTTVPLYTQVRSDYPSDDETGFWSKKEYGNGGTGGYVEYRINIETAGDYTLVINGKDDADAENTRVQLAVVLYGGATPFYGRVKWPAGDSQYKNVELDLGNLAKGSYKLRFTSIADYVDANNPGTDSGNLNVYLDWLKLEGSEDLTIKIEAEDNTKISRLKGGFIGTEGSKSIVVIDGYSCGRTIAHCGCAMVSMVMLGRYYNIGSGIDANNTDPFSMNNWLKRNSGYTQNGSLFWVKSVEYLGFIENDTTMVRLTFDKYNATEGDEVDDHISASKPVVTFSSPHGHYFVMDGKTEADPNGEYTYTIKDPVWYNTKTLNDTKNIAEKIQGYSNKWSKANLFTYLETPCKIDTLVEIILESPAELLITDPQGRRLGNDPVSGITYNEIPDAIYTGEEDIVSSEEPIDLNNIHKSKIIRIPTPLDGNYEIKVIGTGNGNYALSLLAYDENGQSKFVSQTGEITINATHEYNLDYEPENIEEMEIAIIDETSPEVSIYFDANSKKLIIIGTDDITPDLEVAIEEQCTKKRCTKKEHLYTISDEAGNTLKLWLERNELKNKIMVNIGKMQYNDDEEININVTIAYNWNKDMKMFLQNISSHKEFKLNALYHDHKGDTRIWGYDWKKNKKIEETKEGLNIIKLYTSEGNLNYEY